MKPSTYQENIYFATKQTDENIQIEAVAGSGKTTTLQGLSSLLPEHQDKAFFAFNRSIANELKNKLPAEVHTSTFNSLGHRVYNQNFHAKLNKNKVLDLLGKRGFQRNDSATWDFNRLIGALKSSLVDGSEEDFPDLIAGIEDLNDLVLPPNKVEVAYSILQENNKALNEIDFNDQLYLPILFDMDFPTYDNIMVDECQDLSPIQMEMIKKMDQGMARFFCVGDTYQAIYGFRGADSGAQARMKDIFSLTSYPLSITYRCPTSIVKEAQKYVPHIEPRENAPQGMVDHQLGYPNISSLGPNTCTLSRTNAPLMRLGLKLILANKPVRLQSNMPQKLIGLILSFKVKTADDLATRLMEFYAQERERLTEKGRTNQLELLEDKKDCILALINTSKKGTVSDIINTLKRLSCSEVGTVLSTIHQSKGQEYKTVNYLTAPGFESWIKQHTAFPQQEDNLKYVAITRAEESLTYWDIEEQEE